jgi:hypothetical protein
MSGFSPAQAMIAAMVTPAADLAASSLIATALVRLARVVDRVRRLSEIQARDPTERLRHQRRALLAKRAVALVFFAVVCFVVAAGCVPRLRPVVTILQ